MLRELARALANRAIKERRCASLALLSLVLGLILTSCKTTGVGFEYERLIGSSLRHLTAFARGEDLDPDSGLQHMAHLATNALFLLDYQLNGFGIDNRFNYRKDK